MAGKSESDRGLHREQYARRQRRVSRDTGAGAPISHTEKGTPRFTRTALALFAGGFATFALLYCVQPMMPMLSQAFGINAAQSSLILSLSTLTLAVGLLITGPISDAIGRKQVLVASLLAAAVFTVGSALAPAGMAFC